MKHRWNMINPDYWQCLVWDVIRKEEGWRVSSASMKLDDVFATARDAMRYIDEKSGKSGG